MNILLLVFALPIAVIIISIALQKIFHNPILVAAIIFSIFLIITFIVEDTLTFLIATIIYTIIAYITAVLTKIVCRTLLELDNNNEDSNGESENSNIGNTNYGEETIDISGRINDYYRRCRR